MRTDWIAVLFATAGLTAATSSAQTEFEAPVRIEADGAPIDTGKDIGHAGALFVDHDGDGRADLLVSSFRGNIRFFRNVGTQRQPAFREGEPLQAGGAPIRIHNW